MPPLDTIFRAWKIEYVSVEQFTSQEKLLLDLVIFKRNAHAFPLCI